MNIAFGLLNDDFTRVVNETSYFKIMARNYAYVTSYNDSSYMKDDDWYTTDGFNFYKDLNIY